MCRRAVPVRTCVGCRERAARSELLRVVAVEGAVVPDPKRRMPGRGAHLHPDPACLALAERRRAFPRALRRAGPLDTSAVREHLQGGDAKRGMEDREGEPALHHASVPDEPESGSRQQ